MNEVPEPGWRFWATLAASGLLALAFVLTFCHP